MRLARSFFDRPTLTVARELLGKELVFYNARGIITETEAYIGQCDPACHAARGKTPRNAPMFGPAGFSYVYFIYGMYHCLNFVTEAEGFPAAVLIRGVEAREPAGEPSLVARSASGSLASAKQELRSGEAGSSRQAGREGSALKKLNGPGKLCRAFGITREHTNLDLTTHPDFYVNDTRLTLEHEATPRIGISQGKELPWRFVAKPQ